MDLQLAFLSRDRCTAVETLHTYYIRAKCGNKDSERNRVRKTKKNENKLCGFFRILKLVSAPDLLPAEYQPHCSVFSYKGNKTKIEIFLDMDFFSSLFLFVAKSHRLRPDWVSMQGCEGYELHQTAEQNQSTTNFGLLQIILPSDKGVKVTNKTGNNTSNSHFVSSPLFHTLFFSAFIFLCKARGWKDWTLVQNSTLSSPKV